MSSTIQITFDAHDPRRLSTFWRDVLGYVHPAPPGVDLPPEGDPLAAYCLGRLSGTLRGPRGAAKQFLGP